MSAALTVAVTDIDGVTKTYGADKTAELVFVRERYTPFTYLKGTFIEEMTAKRVKEICLYFGETLLHKGTADRAEYSREGGAEKLRLVSYGYSKQLGQDFAEPGIIQTPDLGTIVGGAGITGVTWQQNTDTVRYVYFDEKTTVWNAACIYTMKAYENHPFIRGANTVLCTVPAGAQTFVLPASDMVSCGWGQSLGNIFSDVYTQDLNDQWSYHLGSSFAAAHNVTRKKYYAADREFVYDLNDELKYHMYFSDRGRQYLKATFKGFLGEELCDTAQLTLGGGTVSYEISGVTLRSTPKGVFTELLFYFDSYCNNT